MTAKRSSVSCASADIQNLAPAQIEGFPIRRPHLAKEQIDVQILDVTVIFFDREWGLLGAVVMIKDCLGVGLRVLIFMLITVNTLCRKPSGRSAVCLMQLQQHEPLTDC